MNKLAERNAEIADLRRDGRLSLTAIGDRYGISPQRVREIAAQHGVNEVEAAKLHAARRHEDATARAKALIPTIMMRYAAGDAPVTISRDLDVKLRWVKDVWFEYKTDMLVAQRRESMSRLAGHESRDPVVRSDAYWTPEQCWKSLVELAKLNGGRLGTTTWYREMTKGRAMLPSLSLVQRRLGRWSYVQAKVNEEVLSGR